MKKIAFLFLLQLFIFAKIEAQIMLQPILLQVQENRTNPTEEYFRPLSVSSLSAYQSQDIVSIVANATIPNIEISIVGSLGEEYVNTYSLNNGESIFISTINFNQGEYILNISNGCSELKGEFIVK